MGVGGNTYDYGLRIYNPQIAKFLSVDPLAPDYPWYTPYQFAGNMPIWAVDLDGLEPVKYTQVELAKLGYPKLNPETSYSFLSERYEKLTKQHWIAKNEKTGKHFFDSEGYVNWYRTTHNGAGSSNNDLSQKRWEALDVMADRFNDKWLFNGQAAERKEQEEKLQAEWNASRIRSVMEEVQQSEFLKAQEITIQDVLTLTIDGSVFVLSLFTVESGVGIAGVLIAADNLQGDVKTILNKLNGEYDPDKVMTLGGVIEQSTLGTNYVYDLVSISFSASGAASAVVNIKEGSKIIKTLETVLNSADIVDDAPKTYQKIKE